MSLLASDLGSNVAPADPISAHIQSAVNPIVWDEGMPRKATQCLLTKLRLKETAECLSKCQYPLRLKAQRGLEPLLDKFIHHGLIVPCLFPCNTPILPVKQTEKQTKHLENIIRSSIQGLLMKL